MSTGDYLQDLVVVDVWRGHGKAGGQIFFRFCGGAVSSAPPVEQLGSPQTENPEEITSGVPGSSETVLIRNSAHFIPRRMISA